MRYFIGTVIIVCIGLYTVSTSTEAPRKMDAPHGFYMEGSTSEITCNVGTCVENITFPAMHIQASLEK